MLGAEPLQVTDALERRGDTTSQLRIGDQLGHGSEAELDRLGVSQGSSEPLAKPSRSHRGARAIHEADEGRQLEIANGGGVERHGRVRGVGAHAEHLGSQACLVCLQVLEQHAGGPDGQWRLARSDRLRKRDPEQVAQPLAAPLRVESVCLDLGRLEELRRSQAFQLSCEPFCRQLAQQQLACRHVAHGQAGFGAVGPGRDQVIRARWLEICLLDDSAWREHTGDVAPDHCFSGWSLELVADDHLVTGAQQLAGVALPGVMRHPAHGRASRLAQRPRGERHAHDRSGCDRVLEEDLVKVPEPEQQYPVGVLLLRFAVLPHDRRQRRRAHAARVPVS